MSDRREAVARAIGNALITRSDIAAVADAAIAAYEATEPTEAEIDAACDAYNEALNPDGVVHHGEPVNAMRAALIAARKARP